MIDRILLESALFEWRIRCLVRGYYTWDSMEAQQAAKRHGNLSRT